MMDPGQKQIALTLLACMLGGITATLQHSLPKSDPKTAVDTEWMPPDLPDTSATLKAYNALSHYYPKNTPTLPGASGRQTVQAWVLQGIVQQGTQQYALIKNNVKITRYRVGGQLPDSSILTAINTNGITISRAGKPQTITLHGAQRK
ncbi:hypothetical protein [Methylovulum sp.]|uniref:hypothetical protein n=1 Tax=Methylovulum sp. TaxID=1916980 RepID=UPI0026361375|nr:hypothetical protein [Methylovulum sp.]MDD5123602.1 hypothetical protein [Methylovulum sp.]